MSKPILLAATSFFTASVLFTSLSFASSSAQTAPEPPLASTSTARGQGLYVAQGCYQCHGFNGQGSVMSGPALTPLRRSLHDFQAYVRAPSGIMPAYSSKILPDADLAAISAYVAAFPVARATRDIPLLAKFLDQRPTSDAASKAHPVSVRLGTTLKPNAAPIVAAGEGARLYAQNCAACHGALMKGGAGVALVGEAGKRSADQTLALLLNPPPAMPKLSPNPLSHRQMQAIAAYIRAPR